MSRESYKNLGDSLYNFSMHGYAIDEAHAMLVYGVVVAHKPVYIIEFGLGPTASLNSVVRAAVTYNNISESTYTVVDNWLDWNYIRPPIADDVEAAGCQVITCQSQVDYIKDIPDSSYDLTISDADHGMEPRLIGQFLRITKPGGIIFSHDANNPSWSDALAAQRNEYRFAHVFSKNSLPNERNERGTVMIFR